MTGRKDEKRRVTGSVSRGRTAQERQLSGEKDTSSGHIQPGKTNSLFNSKTEGFALHEIICDQAGNPCDYRFLEMNPAFERLTGLKRKLLQGRLKSQVEQLGGDDPKWIEIYGKVALTGHPVHFEYHSPALKRHFEVFAYRPAANQFATMFIDITERKKIELKLAESEERKRELVLHSSAGIYEVNFQTKRFTAVNDVMSELTGYTRQELLQMSPMDILAPESRVLFQERLQQWLDGIKPDPNVEYRVIKKDGGVLYTLLSVTFTRAPDGTPLGATVIGYDITERKKVEQALRDSEAKANALIKYAPIIIYEIDNRGPGFSSVNDAMCQTLGYTREELFSIGPIRLLDENGQALFAERMKKQLAGESIDESMEYRLRKKDGGFVDALVHFSLYTSMSEPYRMLVVAEDITERKQAAQALARSNQKISEILSSIKDDFYVLDHDWKFVYANKQFTGKVGKEPEDLVGKSIWEMFPKHIGSDLYKNLHASMEKGEVRRFDIGGLYTKAFYSMTSFPSAEGITVLGTDITERKRAEVELQNAQELTERRANELDAIFNGISEAIIVYDANGRVQRVNQAVLELLGFDPRGEDIVGLAKAASIRTIDGDPLDPAQLPTAAALKGNIADRKRIIVRDRRGQDVFIVASAAPIKAGERIIGAVAAWYDVTERERLLMQVREQGQKAESLAKLAEQHTAEIETVFNTMTDSIIVYGPDEIATRSNAAARAMFGFDPTGVDLAKNMASSGTTEGARASATRALHGEAVKEAEFEYTSPAGERRTVSTSSTPIRDSQGHIIGALTVARDNTERKRAEEEVQAARNELELRVQERTLELKQSNQQLRLENEERQRMADSLHDAVNQSLFSAGLIAEVLPRLWERDQEEARKSLKDLRRLTKSAQGEMRVLLAELRPSVVTDSGLDYFLEHLSNAFTGRTNLPVTISLKGKMTLQPEAQVVFYRVAQEALNNIAKHAKASRVEVEFQNEPDQATIRITDDGRGFDPQALKGTHYGLRMMQERAKTIGARLSIDSQPGHGTRLCLSWKKKKK